MSSSKSSSKTSTTSTTEQKDQKVGAEDQSTVVAHNNFSGASYTNNLSQEVVDILQGAGELGMELVKTNQSVVETSLNRYAEIKAGETDMKGAINFLQPILITIAIIAVVYFGSKIKRGKTNG